MVTEDRPVLWYVNQRQETGLFAELTHMFASKMVGEFEAYRAY
jgi:membrane-bound lytic murein transglycosylase MltF